MPEWLSIQNAAEYCGKSTRWIEQQIQRRDNPLPAKRVSGRRRHTGSIMISRSELERWIRSWPDYQDTLDIDSVVNDAMDFLRRNRTDE